jgi:peroxiredoxin
MKNLLIPIFLVFVLHASGQENCFDDCKTSYEQFEDSIYSAIPDSALAGNVLMKISNEKISKIINGLVGCKAPAFSVKTIHGKTLSLSELTGKIIVLNFWFAKCSPCVAEIPALNKLVAEYKDSAVVFIAFSSDSSQVIENFLLDKEFNYDLISSAFNISKKYCVFGYPTNMVIDQKGVLRLVFRGGYIDKRAETDSYNKIKPMIFKCLSEGQ